MEIKVRNVNQAFAEVFWRLRALDLQPEQSRNGPVLAFPSPVIITYEKPWERVLFHAGRDANPIFHLLESIWMLAGRSDVAFLQQFNSRIGQYSDDGVAFNAPYGFRWREHFGFDQLTAVIELLRRDPSTRQAVIQMWDPADLTKQTFDKACNMSVIFDLRGGRLNMTVMNRSNDLWYGALGANAVHMSILQELVASALRRPVGQYRQISNNMHLYTELYSAGAYLQSPPDPADYDAYTANNVSYVPLMLNADYGSFLGDCAQFCDDPFNAETVYHHEFFQAVAVPMAMVSRVRKLKAGTGEGWASKIRASDWRTAVFDWIQRREAAKLKG